MIKMTFMGMQMLHSLRQAGCRVPPLDDGECNGATLLEVMPGAALRAFRLPDKGYKGNQNVKAFENRQRIIRELPKSSKVNVINLHDLSDEAMFSDDALDSMVATVAAAKWAMDGSDDAFTKPSKQNKVADALVKYKGSRRISPGIKHLTEEEAARREGWIYAPKK